MKKVAFVGAEERKLLSAGLSLELVEKHLRELMTEAKSLYGPYVFISGASPRGGVDIIAEKIADELGLEKQIFPPAVHRWTGTANRPGYKERNTAIATTCDILYNLDPEGVHSGGDWTLRLAHFLGKEVHRIEMTRNSLLIWS